jgi:hypothetical protein
MLAAAPAAGVAVLMGGTRTAAAGAAFDTSRLIVDLEGGYLVPAEFAAEVLRSEGGVVAAWNRALSPREVAMFHRDWTAMFDVRATGRAI